MNKQLWYANSTGGVPYTYGEMFTKEHCKKCNQGRQGNGIFHRKNVTEIRINFPLNGTRCPNCEGKGFNRMTIKNERN